MSTIKTTLSTTLAGAVAAALLLPVLASAQPSAQSSGQSSGQTADAAYCTALVKTYQTYLDTESKRGRLPQSLESREGVARCQSGDPAGIAALEKALNNARIPLPARG